MTGHERPSSADPSLGATERSGEPRRNGSGLEIHPDAISDQAIQGLLGDLLVPLIVDRLIENLTKLR